MKRLLTSYALLWTVIVGLVVLLATRSHSPALDPTLKAEVSRLQASRASDSVAIDSLKRSALASADVAERAVARARGLARAAADKGRLADSLARSAVLRDSARTGSVTGSDNKDSVNPWRLAYEARTGEADSLLASNAELTRAHVADSLSIFRLSAGLDRALERQRALDVLNTRLSKAVEKSNRCRVAVVIPCPTRTQAAVGGAILGSVLAVLSLK